MRTLYLDCGMGAAGDMLTAALLELFPDPDALVAELNRLGVPGVRYERERTQKCGIQGTHIHVYVGATEEGEEHHHHSHEHSHDHSHEHSHDHHHSGMKEIEHWISHIHVSDGVKGNIHAVYQRIAQAESHVHGVDITDIHFHEVGTLDALADVTAVCYLMEKLGNPKVYASPVHVGSGHVYCAHGILPVPAPATAEILKGIPIYGGQIQGELCTPTGAALLKQFVTEFGNMPVMTPQAVGYGMGKKDFAMANCVRAVLGETGSGTDSIVELNCNLDDMTGEDIGFAMEQLLAAGAPEVFTTPISMKKNRPGVMLTVLCREEQREEMVALLFRHTTTLGIRETPHRRYTLTRRTAQAETPYGPVSCKLSQGYGVTRCKPEYDDLARLARENAVPISQVRETIKGI